MLALSPLYFYVGFRTAYINSAVTHYESLLKISAPYIDNDTEKRIISSFAQIKNKNDYVIIIDKLKRISTENGQSVPEFSIW